MAEAMCGPSNALQQFKQQTDVDRSLLQDRLTSSSRQHPAQSFRSHNPNASLLDSAFETFQAGPEPVGFDRHHIHAPPFEQYTGQGAAPQAPSWATDFQRLQITTSPVQQQPQIPLSPNVSEWTQGFRQQIAQAAPKHQNATHSPLHFQQRARGFGRYGFQHAFTQSSITPAIQSNGKEPTTVERFDEAAFDRAFDQVQEDMMAGDTEMEDQMHSASTNDAMAEKFEAFSEQSAREMLHSAAQDMDNLSKPHYHASNVHAEPQQMLQEESAQQQRQYEDDALAATAHELLLKVEHNQSDKFKNSQFLELMRKLRDREMRVEGDKMVETADALLTSPNDALNTSSTTAERVYHSKQKVVPLPATVAIQSSEFSATIPPQEQDHDLGRIYPQDGQEVINILNEPGPITDDIDPNVSISFMLYGFGGTLSR